MTINLLHIYLIMMHFFFGHTHFLHFENSAGVIMQERKENK